VEPDRLRIQSAGADDWTCTALLFLDLDTGRSQQTGLFGGSAGLGLTEDGIIIVSDWPHSFRPGEPSRYRGIDPITSYYRFDPKSNRLIKVARTQVHHTDLVQPEKMDHDGDFLVAAVCGSVSLIQYKGECYVQY